MTAKGGEVAVEIEGRRLKLSNLEKLFYPATGFTKGQVIDYYIRVAPALLPHLRDRPLTLKRYPNGVEGAFFYEKRCPSHRPDWVRTEAVWSEVNQDVIPFCVVDDLATLVWAANLADLEMHTYLHHAPEVDRPTVLAFDLDPGPPAGLLECCEVALFLRELFEHLGLEAWPKTSGSKGLQVYVPLNSRVTYQRTKAFARGVAEALEARRPDLVVSSMKKALRAGKVLVDWSQNDAHKTTVSAYSLRAKERPTASTPVRWDEVEAALAARDPARLTFEAPAVLERVAEHGDLFAPVLKKVQELPGVDGITSAGAAQRSRGAARRPPSGTAPPPAPRGDERRPRPARKAGRGGARPQATGARRAGGGESARPHARSPRKRRPSRAIPPRAMGTPCLPCPASDGARRAPGEGGRHGIGRHQAGARRG